MNYLTKKKLRAREDFCGCKERNTIMNYLTKKKLSMPPRRHVVRPRGGGEHRHEDGKDQRREENGPPPPPPDMNAQMLAGMNRFFAQFAGNNAAVAARPTGPEATYERFMKTRSKEFSGTTDPMIAEGWIKSLEVIFEFIELGDADRVRCATYLFGGDARLWWEGASVALNLVTLSWTRFTEVRMHSRRRGVRISELAWTEREAKSEDRSCFKILCMFNYYDFKEWCFQCFKRLLIATCW
ncbi:uncharacterized protein LOC142547805 [Primulina tabacum]|uniref:uncharacterized protein LOC142547805 n=1 Tax=Primulina tabacum TaxID=48773 RepID=UPI003F592F55